MKYEYPITTFACNAIIYLIDKKQYTLPFENLSNYTDAVLEKANNNDQNEIYELVYKDNFQLIANAFYNFCKLDEDNKKFLLKMNLNKNEKKILNNMKFSVNPVLLKSLTDKDLLKILVENTKEKIR